MVGSTSVRVETQRRDEVETIVSARTKSIAVCCLLIDLCLCGGCSLISPVISEQSSKEDVRTLRCRNIDDSEDVVETRLLTDQTTSTNTRAGFRLKKVEVHH